MTENKIYKLKLTDQFKADMEKHRFSGQVKNLAKITRLLQEIVKNPYVGIGDPEPLTFDRKGEWSRRITRKHRLVYSVNDEKITVLMISSWGHYGDK
ncbi:MAG: Txe/YoeB family addiction module toxin [Candidatus Symbiothrix sp.]|jgi:toxin YoeB|nr:Txe/YoeB family addiction module toxin [Candidatus Symbiothrix sp.]